MQRQQAVQWLRLLAVSAGCLLLNLKSAQVHGWERKHIGHKSHTAPGSVLQQNWTCLAALTASV